MKFAILALAAAVLTSGLISCASKPAPPPPPATDMGYQSSK